MGFSPDGTATLALNWDDWKNGTQDFDLYVLDQNGNEVVSSTDRQTGPGSDAGEFIYYEFPDSGPYYLQIYAVNATRAVTFDFFLREGALEYYNPEYSVNTPGDAKSSLTVGATNWEIRRAGGLQLARPYRRWADETGGGGAFWSEQRSFWRVLEWHLSFLPACQRRSGIDPASFPGLFPSTSNRFLDWSGRGYWEWRAG